MVWIAAAAAAVLGALVAGGLALVRLLATIAEIYLPEEEWAVLQSPTPRRLTRLRD